jgi:hypothetical protein
LELFDEGVGKSHDVSKTPHVAVAVMASLIFLSPAVLTKVFGPAIPDAFNDVEGRLASWVLIF